MIQGLQLATQCIWLLTLGAHAQEGYGTCPVCLCVCLLPLNRRHRSFLRSTYGTCGTLLGFSSFLTRGFSKTPSDGKLWREKANMQMSSYCSRPVLARYEYRAYISTYLQAAHWVSDRFLARFVHRGCCYGIYY